jgi:hypothetical protein
MRGLQHLATHVSMRRNCLQQQQFTCGKSCRWMLLTITDGRQVDLQFQGELTVAVRLGW